MPASSSSDSSRCQARCLLLASHAFPMACQARCLLLASRAFPMVTLSRAVSPVLVDVLTFHLFAALNSSI